MESGTVDVAPPIPRPGLRRGNRASLSIRLSAVIIAATVNEPRVLTVRIGTDTVEALPSGPLEVEHRTLEVGLRAWVERQTGQKLGYVEQLYTFGDRDRIETGESRPSRALTVAYLALVREARLGGAGEAVWQNWYRHFPWEDWRDGKPAVLASLEEGLFRWADTAATEAERRLRAERLGLAFATAWNEELVLERYELLYEAGLIEEACRGRWQSPVRGQHAGIRRGDGGGPPPHPRDRDRPAARQDQISPGRIRADAAVFYAAAIAAHGRGVVRRAVA